MYQSLPVLENGILAYPVALCSFSSNAGELEQKKNEMRRQYMSILGRIFKPYRKLNYSISVLLIKKITFWFFIVKCFGKNQFKFEKKLLFTLRLTFYGNCVFKLTKKETLVGRVNRFVSLFSQC